MAVVEPQTQYIAQTLTPTSGGIGIFDPSTIVQQIQGLTITNYVFTILDDPRFTFRTDQSASPDCQSQDSCNSFLMTGGLQLLNPLPGQPVTDRRLTAYIARDVPSYQFDSWDMSNTPVNFTFGDCQLYNIPPELTATMGFYLCIRNEPDGSILAGLSVHSLPFPSPLHSFNPIPTQPLNEPPSRLRPLLHLPRTSPMPQRHRPQKDNPAQLLGNKALNLPSKSNLRSRPTKQHNPFHRVNLALPANIPKHPLRRPPHRHRQSTLRKFHHHHHRYQPPLQPKHARLAAHRLDIRTAQYRVRDAILARPERPAEPIRHVDAVVHARLDGSAGRWHSDYSG